MCLALAGGTGLSPAVSQEKPAASTISDPRVQPLIGTWEGRVNFAKSESARAASRDDQRFSIALITAV